ncbi:YiiX/YebB-like N1pC/P60 family cysteine hydrolase [Thermosphaera sp.]
MRILLYRGVSLLSRLIRWRTWSEYSHVALEIHRGEIVDAWKGGVRLIRSPFEGHDPETVVEAYEIAGLRPEQAARAALFARAQIGKPYDYWGVLRFIIRRDPTQPNDRWFCSELVFAALLHGGVRLLERVPAHRASPGDLARSPLLRRVPL